MLPRHLELEPPQYSIKDVFSATPAASDESTNSQDDIGFIESVPDPNWISEPPLPSWLAGVTDLPEIPKPEHRDISKVDLINAMATSVYVKATYKGNRCLIKIVRCRI